LAVGGHVRDAAPAGGIYVEAAAMERLVAAYDRLSGMALGSDDALAFIRSAAKGMK
jgi:hypothetical protein